MTSGSDDTQSVIFTLIETGEIYAPEPMGVQSILLANDKIIKIGNIAIENLLTLDIPCEVINARDCLVIPGLIDPHQHIIGAGGENGFVSRMPEILLSQEVSAGITTIVGLLGTDTSTRQMQCLHAKACQFWDEGITTYIYTGGFELPPRTLTQTPMDDLVMIDKIIGTGEIAISDERFVDPERHELAKIVTQTMLGGKIGGKAGITHFHVGAGKRKLDLLHELLENYQIKARYLYPTHITRSHELMRDAIQLAKQGSYVDIDTVEENLADCWQYYHDHGGPPEMLTVSSDTYTEGGSPSKLFRQLVSCVRDHGLALENILPCFTSNTADALQLTAKGRLRPRLDADLVILDKHSLEVLHVLAAGHHFVKDGQVIRKSHQERQLEEAQA